MVIRLDELVGWLRIANRKKEIYVVNRDRFKQGFNAIEIDLEDADGDGIEQTLAQGLISGKNYNLGIALVDGNSLGPVSTATIYLNPRKQTASE
jgi:hypothetical protein